MLAYVFWHWPSPDVPVADYEKFQREFHRALASAAPNGLLGSCVYRVDGEPPWLAPARATNVPAYADWYLLENSAAIDGLNVAAVSGVCEQPHAAVARAMAQGAGSLFSARTELGEPSTPNLANARHLTFLTKPRPMAYADFYSEVAPFAASQSTLWRRALVLGSTPEFALLNATPTEPAANLHPLALALTPITA